MMGGNVRDEENMGTANIPTPTKTDMCTSFSSFFPVSFTNNAFPSQPVAVNSEADPGIGTNLSLPSSPTPVDNILAEHSQSSVLYSSDSGEAVGNLKLVDTGSTDSDDEDDYIGAIGGRAGKRSFLKSITCISTLAILMMASVGFLASLFIVYPRRGEGESNVNYTFEDGQKEIITTEFEVEEDIFSSQVEVEEDIFSSQVEVGEDTSSSAVTDTISPSLSPTADMYSLSPTLSPMSPDPTPQPSEFPSVSPSQNPTLRAVSSIALEAVEDTFIMRGATQLQGKGKEQTFGKETTLRVKGGADATIVSIVRFDTTPLIELGATVVRTKLSLFARTNSVFGGQINLASNDCLWTEKDTSWANAPNCILKTGVVTTGQLDGWMGTDLLGWFSEDIVPNEWNETNLDWHPKQKIPSQITLIISSGNPDGVTYASRDNDKNERPRPPTITVEYYNARDDEEVI